MFLTFPLLTSVDNLEGGKNLKTSRRPASRRPRGRHRIVTFLRKNTKSIKKTDIESALAWCSDLKDVSKKGGFVHDSILASTRLLLGMFERSSFVCAWSHLQRPRPNRKPETSAARIQKPMQRNQFRAPL